MRHDSTTFLKQRFLDLSRFPFLVFCPLARRRKKKAERVTAPAKRSMGKYRAGSCHHWFHFASILFPILVFLLCAGTAIGQESQQEAHREARVWLEFNHHVGGVVVLVLAGLTWLEVLGIGLTVVVRLAWPSCLILIGLYNVIFSDRFAWPIGSSGLIEILSNPEVLQHIKFWPSWF